MESAAWAEVLPASGTLEPGETMMLAVVFDSTAVPGPGDYSDTLSFSGTFDNSPADVDLILHVLEGEGYRTYMPMMIGDGGGPTSPGKVGTAVWWLPLAGLVVLLGIGRRRY
jgi:MYXO-CTERM domain-containing protein